MMKDIKYLQKNYGVSPVIAIILLIAITMVLAAALYYTISLNTPTYTRRVYGKLIYIKEQSDLNNITKDYATFQLILTSPDQARVDQVIIKLLADNATEIKNFTYEWIHMSSDEEHINYGDYLKIMSDDIEPGYVVILSIKGWEGTIEGYVE